MANNSYDFLHADISSLEYKNLYHLESYEEGDPASPFVSSTVYTLNNYQSKTDGVSSPKLTSSDVNSTHAFVCSDICERIPYLPKDLLTSIMVFPLGGNLRGFSGANYFGSALLNKYLNSTDGGKNYSDLNFDRFIGSHWEGAFSLGNLAKNGNLIGNPYEGFTTTPSGSNLFSVLHDYDRISFNHIAGEPSNFCSYSRTFTESGDHCFSFYVKASNPTTITSNIAAFASEEGVVSGTTINVPDHYVRVGFIGSGNFTVSFTASTSNPCKLDFCGLCYSAGKVPVEIDYRTDGIKRPLAIQRYDTSNPWTSWTIKYKRYLFCNNDTQPVYKDWINGYEIPYPKYPNEVELVTVRKDGSSVKCDVRCKDEKITFTPSNSGVPSLSIGDKSLLVLLGADTSFNATPGLYRDLIIVKEKALSDEVSDSIDNSLMSVAFDIDGVSYIKSSFIKETLK